MHPIKLIAATLLALALGLSASCAQASDGQFGSITKIALQQHFALTEGLLARYEAAHADVHASPCKALTGSDLQALQQGHAPAFDQMTARYDAQPVMHAILARHGITAKDYLLTQAVLGAARIKYGHQMMEKVNPHAASDIDPSMTLISAGNYSFYTTHRSQIQQAALREIHSQSPAVASGNAACLVDKLRGK